MHATSRLGQKRWEEKPRGAGGGLEEGVERRTKRTERGQGSSASPKVRTQITAKEEVQ